jgi:hypothetical protein
VTGSISPPCHLGEQSTEERDVRLFHVVLVSRPWSTLAKFFLLKQSAADEKLQFGAEMIRPECPKCDTRACGFGIACAQVPYIYY